MPERIRIPRRPRKTLSEGAPTPNPIEKTFARLYRKDHKANRQEIEATLKRYGAAALSTCLEHAQALGNTDESDEILWGLVDALDHKVLPPAALESSMPTLLRMVTTTYNDWTESLEVLITRLSAHPPITDILRAAVAACFTEGSDPKFSINLLHIVPKEIAAEYIGKPEAITRLQTWAVDGEDMFYSNHRTNTYVRALTYCEPHLRLPLFTSILESLVRGQVDVFSIEHIDSAIEQLPGLGREGLIVAFKNVAKRYRDVDSQGYMTILAERMLPGINSETELGITDDEDELAETGGADYADRQEELDREARTAYEKEIQQRLSVPDAKIRIFKESSVLKKLPDPQAWLSVHTPEEARTVFDTVMRNLRTEKERGALSNIFKQRLDMRRLADDVLIYYPDEVIDALVEYGDQHATLKTIDEWRELCGRLGITQEKETSVRYIRRTIKDMRLGDKCGDCTARGSINYENSFNWLINPAYQILQMQEAGQFMGRMNLALAEVGGRDALFIDALEFHPQACEGGPYNARAQRAFEYGLQFVQRLAAREQRRLYAVAFSNSTPATTILRERGRRVPHTHIAPVRDEAGYRRNTPVFSARFTIPRDVINTIERNKASLWYQAFSQIVRSNPEDEGLRFADTTQKRDALDDRLYILERDVFNPAQIHAPAIAAAMRERNFEQAARLIMDHTEYNPLVTKFFGGLEVHPRLLARKMLLLYPETNASAQEVVAGVLLNNSAFVELPIE